MASFRSQLWLKNVEQFANPADVQSAFQDGEWNKMPVIGRGPRLIRRINGVVLADLTDEQSVFSSRPGVIAFQDHGKGTVVEFKGIQIRYSSQENN